MSLCLSLSFSLVSCLLEAEVESLGWLCSGPRGRHGPRYWNAQHVCADSIEVHWQCLQGCQGEFALLKAFDCFFLSFFLSFHFIFSRLRADTLFGLALFRFILFWIWSDLIRFDCIWFIWVALGSGAMFALIIYFIHIFRYFCPMWTSWMSFLFSGWVLAIFHLLSPIIFFHHLNKLSLYSVPAFSVILSDTNIFIFVSCGLCCFVLLCVTLLCFGVVCCVVLCGMSCAEECVVFSYVVCCLCSVVLYCGCLRLSYHIISYYIALCHIESVDLKVKILPPFFSVLLCQKRYNFILISSYATFVYPI